MKQVWKYKVSIGKSKLGIPRGGKILYVSEQFNEICIWVEVYPDRKKELRYIEVFGTGHNIKEEMSISHNYLGTVKLDDGEFVFHVYEYTFNL